MPFNEIDTLAVNAIRALAIDMIEKANSGHPGLPLGLAPAAYALWSRHLNHNPSNPDWLNRDRFVLSAGHGSAMLYAMLHLFGYGLSMDELKRFRQSGSLTPGHPEYGRTKGVETTTGPLGQGFANAVGMAIAEKHLSTVFNTPEFGIINHHTYALAGDGDLMEGVSNEAASIAGHMKLNKLVCLYDSNGITIDGSTAITFTEDVKKRFLALEWDVLEVMDGNDLEELDHAFKKAKKSALKPTLIIAKTNIGFASPKQDKSSVHGEPLKKEEVLATKKTLGWPWEEPFKYPEELLPHFEALALNGIKTEKKWLKLLASYREKHTELAAKLNDFFSPQLPESAIKDEDLLFDKPLATREASNKALNLLAGRVENLIGGSADLAASTKTDFAGYPERNLHFGIREHAMGAIINGMALHGGLRPFGSTFLVFSDYMRPAIRLAAMMDAPSTFVFTHDSVGLGEDGPTHQPVEHIMSLRLIPNLAVWRPADAYETFYAWEQILKNRKPACLLLSRQKLPIQATHKDRIKEGLKKGGYIIKGNAGISDVEIIASGSEVPLALDAAALLEKGGIMAKVISMPCTEVFAAQPSAHRSAVLDKALPKVFIEAGRSSGWKELADSRCLAIGIETFGESAPDKDAFTHFGFTPEAVTARIKEFLGK
ncbi:MAG: transketolase [Elusimicrobia bacterium RIFOXYA12_FULL_51_18]|nr:MAG: transketolase [Elusimicrobia bacterium RIFOXYA12_FULL_51_18]OGS31493.1 MAG: transketolase [Elusimicrobia bacterium RIFOXYA2_FULL_53_38]